MGRSCPREGSRGALPNKIWAEAAAFDAQTWEEQENGAHKCSLKTDKAVTYAKHLEAVLKNLNFPNIESKIGLRIADMAKLDTKISATFFGTHPSRFGQRFKAEAEKKERLDGIIEGYENEIVNSNGGSKKLFSSEKKKLNAACDKIDRDVQP